MRESRVFGFSAQELDAAQQDGLRAGLMTTEATTSIFQGLFQLFLRAKYKTKSKAASHSPERIAASTAADTPDRGADPLTRVHADSPLEEHTPQ